MALQQSNRRYLAYKRQDGLGQVATQLGAKVVRRVSTSLNLTKEEYSSNEKRLDFQQADTRHGTRRVQGGIQAEFYTGVWSDFLGSLLRRDFAAIQTVGAAAGNGLTLVGSTGVLSFASAPPAAFAGLKVGQVVRLSGMNAANNARNLLITAKGASSVTLFALDKLALVDDPSPVETATIQVPGLASFIPRTGHTTHYYTIEDHALDLDTSEVFTDCVIGGAAIAVPATGLATIDFNSIVGLKQERYAGSLAPYFTNPTQAGAQRALAPTPGYVRLAGNLVAVVTGITINIDLGLEAPSVVGSDNAPDVFYGPSAVITGQITAFVTNQTLLASFDSETEVELNVVLEVPGPVPRNFVSIFLPRVKLNSANKDDPERGVVQTFDFRALIKLGDTAYEETTLFIQDSSAA